MSCEVVARVQYGQRRCRLVARHGLPERRPQRGVRRRREPCDDGAGVDDRPGVVEHFRRYREALAGDAYSHQIEVVESRRARVRHHRRELDF